MSRFSDLTQDTPLPLGILIFLSLLHIELDGLF
jgi:hypothetical protein